MLLKFTHMMTVGAVCMRVLAVGVFLFTAVPAVAVEVQEVTSEKKDVTAWLVEAHHLPILSVRMTFDKTGSAYDPKGKSGVASLAVRMLTQGAGERDAKAFQEALDYHAITLGFTVDHDAFSVTLETLAEHQEVAFALLRDALLEARFEAQDFDRVKAERLAQLKKLQESPEFVAEDAFQAQLFKGHPYARGVRGEVESVSAITVGDVKDFAKKALAKEHLQISVVGDITPEALSGLLNTYLSDLPEARGDLGKVAKATPQLGTSSEETRELVQSVVMFGLPSVMRDDPNFYAAYVLNYMLGGNGLSSRLGKEIRAKQGLAYYAYSTLDGYDEAAVLKGSFATRNAAVGQATASLKAVLKDLYANGFDQAELDDAKSYLTGSFPVKISSNEKLVGYLKMMQRYGLGKNYLDNRNSLINKVSLDEVNGLAHLLLNPEQLAVMTLRGIAEK